MKIGTGKVPIGIWLYRLCVTCLITNLKANKGTSKGYVNESWIGDIAFDLSFFMWCDYNCLSYLNLCYVNVVCAICCAVIDPEFHIG